MRVWEHIKTIGNLLGGFMKKQAPSDQISEQAVASYLNYFTFIVRVVLLGVAMFIFMFWPVDAYDAVGFDAWSARMEALPDEVWYFLFTMILGWAGTEMVSSRSRSAIKMKALDAIVSTAAPAPTIEDEVILTEDVPAEAAVDFMQAGDDPGMAGRVDPDDEFFEGAAPSNPSIEQWRQNET